MKTMTAGELKDRLLKPLRDLDDDVQVTLGGGALSLYRLKWRSDKLLDIEFNEVFNIQADPDDLT